MSPQSGRVEHAVIDSEVLRGNPLGDPHVRTVPIVLPPSYDADPARRYPVVFLLAGFTGRGLGFLNDKAFEEPLDQRMERLVADGCPEAILVLPDGMTRWGGSQYVDSSATGRYEEHLAVELPAFIDARYRTIPGARAVAGKSSGGFGALSLLMRRPGVFRAGACHSGDVLFELCYARDFADAASHLERTGGLARFLERFGSLRGRERSAASKTLNVVAMATCYSPDESAPLGFRLPFDEHTAEIIPEVWERWLAHDPLRLLDTRAEALSALALLYIDCGTRDEFALHFGARAFCRKLTTLGIEHVHEEHDDGHFDINYRYDESLPRLIRALG